MNNTMNDRINVYNSSPRHNLPGSSMKKKVFHWISLQCQPSAICHTQQKEPKKTRKNVLGDLFWDGGRGTKKNKKKSEKKTKYSTAP